MILESHRGDLRKLSAGIRTTSGDDPDNREKNEVRNDAPQGEQVDAHGVNGSET
jgi:hypothetical protein